MTNTQTFTAEQNETFAANWNAKAEAAHKAGNTEFARSCWAEWETFHDAAQEARTAERAERFSGDTTSAWENQTR